MQNDSGQQRLRELGGGRILPLLWKFAWPALVTMTLNNLYNAIDRIYIGHGCGQEAIAGLTLTTPVMMVMGAFGPLIGVGSGTIISIKLGQKDMAGAERTLGQCVALKLLLGVTVAPVLFLCLGPILRAMAGTWTSSCSSTSWPIWRSASRPACARRAPRFPRCAA